MKREIVLLQQAHVSLAVPHHLQGALHPTARLHALPEGGHCEWTALSPGLGYVKARRGGGVSRAWVRQGYRCRNMRGLILCCPTQARVATRPSAFPFRVYVTCHQGFIRSRMPPSSVGVDIDPRLLHVIDVLLLSHSGHTHGPCTASPQASGAWRARLNRYASVLDDLASKNRRRRNTQALGHGREGRV